MSKLIIERSLSIEVGQFLSERGFLLADNRRRRLNILEDSDHIGILSKDQEVLTKKYLWRTITKKLPRKFIGLIWFTYEELKITPWNWFFQVYGIENVEKLRELAEEMSHKFDVQITLKLITDTPKEEYIPRIYPVDF